MKLSLHRRLLLGASVVLAVFLGLTGLALDRAFRQSLEDGLRERLLTHVYALLAASDLGPDGTLQLAGRLPEARFASPGSGLYARIRHGDGNTVWQSGSMLGLDLDFPVPVTTGTAHYVSLKREGVDLLALSFGIEWESEQGRIIAYTFGVAEDLGTTRAQVSGFRQSLWTWLGGSLLLLLLVQGSILRWSLRPLRRVGTELTEIERGGRERLGGDYPPELAPLTQGINRFITQEQARLEHYRRGLGDLAHSLKTPLAVLRGALEERAGDVAREAAHEIDRMADIVEYHLQRAATAGRRPLAAPVPLAEIVARVADSLAKVHHARAIDCRTEVAPGCRYRAEEGDLFELVGNMADNAFKWCTTQVRVRAVNEGDASNPALRLTVEDDGPGFPDGALDRLTLRGLRADSTTPGHGIGLAMVNDLVAAYAGRLETGRSEELGGARIDVLLPG